VSTAGETVGRDVVEIPLPPRRQVCVVLEDLDNKRTRLKPPTARTLKLNRAYEVDPTQVELLWEIAATLLPDLTPDEVELLTADTILRVAELASQPIADLEQIAKNAVAPLAEAGKALNSVTPSPTESAGSPRRSGRRRTT
jgi:hypothetical protein